MELISQITVKDIKNNKLRVFEIIISTMAIVIMYLLFNTRLIDKLNSITLSEVLYVVIWNVVCLIIHEGIHIICFIHFGRGEAKIKVRYFKGAIVIHQKNPNLYYSKLETLIMLASPCLVIGLALIPFIWVNYSSSMLVALVVLLNTCGSTIDLILCYKLLKYPNDIKVAYDTEKLQMNIFG